MMHRLEQRRMPRDAPRQSAQRHLDACDIAIRHEPLLIAHVGPDVAQAIGEKVNMLIDRPMGAIDERLQRLAGVRLEIAGQEMIEEDVGDHARPVAVLRDQHAAERGDGRMGVGEGVDPAVLHDALPDLRRKPIMQRPFHEIAGEVADQRLGTLAGEKEMGQIVHRGAITVTCWVSLFVTETKAQTRSDSTSRPTDS